MKQLQMLFALMLMMFAASVSVFEITASIRNKESVSMEFNGTKPDICDIVKPEQLPPMGKWMYLETGERAHWLGVPWNGKNLIEPINVILLDKNSQSSIDAEKRLYDNLQKAGFTKRDHHSSGYTGFIGYKFFPQIPQEKYHAFSDNVAEKTNNHGRLFGPYYYNGMYVFIGAFSREVLERHGKIGHGYQSFKSARDEFAKKMCMTNAYRMDVMVDLKNMIVDSNDDSTGDHDGEAVVLVDMDK
jgi:hypothetical protein